MHSILTKPKTSLQISRLMLKTLTLIHKNTLQSSSATNPAESMKTSSFFLKDKPLLILNWIPLNMISATILSFSSARKINLNNLKIMK